jgi:hypothetical protein
MSTLDNVIATLNTLDVGSLDAISEKLLAAREALVVRDGEAFDDVVDKIDACRDALTHGRLEEFRRLRETIVSRLGHLRQKAG